MVDNVFSIDDFDWSGTPGPSTGDPAVSGTPEQQTAPEAPPPAPEPPPAPARQGRSNRYKIDQSLLPPSYREYKGDQYKQPRPAGPQLNIDDFDWGGVEAPASTYKEEDDWDITTGFKVGSEGATKSLGILGEMGRIALLPKEQQAAELLKLSKQPDDPGAAKLQVDSIDKIGGVGDALTFALESMGQMAGSMWGAAKTGGGIGALTGAGIGGAAGSGVGGVGALPGAAAGAVTGFGWGTLGAFGGMGVGGMFQDLLHDKGVQEGLANGTVDPSTIFGWATGAGAVIGALDSVPVGKLISKVGGKNITAASVKQLVKKAALGGALKGAAMEGGTEGLQGSLSELAQAIVGGDLNTQERLLSVLNQAVVGGLGGALPGAAGEVIENARIPGVANPAVPAGTAATPPPAQATPTPPVGGTGAIPPPPAGAAPPSPGRDQAKPGVATPGAPVSTSPVDPTLGAALGVEQQEEEEFDEEDDEDFAGQTAPIAARSAVAPAPPTVVNHSAEAPDNAAALGAGQPQAAAANVPTPVVPEGVPPAEPPATPPPTGGVEGVPPPQPPAGEPSAEAVDPSLQIMAEGAGTWGNPPGQEAQPAADEPGPTPTPLAEDIEATQRLPEERAPSGVVPTIHETPSLAALVGSEQAALTPAVAAKKYNKLSKARQKVLLAFAEALDSDNPTDVEDARRKLASLTGDAKQFFYDSLDPRMRSRIPAPMEEAAAPQKPAKERAAPKLVEAPAEPEPRPVREPAVAIQAVPEDVAAFTPTTVAKRLRVTPSMTQKMRAKHTFEAKAVEPVAKPHSLGFTMPDSQHIPRLRKAFPRMAKMTDKEIQADTEYKSALTTRRLTEEYLEEIGATVPRERKGVTKEDAAKETTHKHLSGMLSKAHKEGQKVVVRHAKSLRKLGEVASINKDGTVSFGKKTMEVGDLFDKHTVDIEGVPQAEGIAPVRRSVRERATEAMRKHFDDSNAPVKLAPLGFSSQEIAALERTGMAEDGTMDAAEFGRWQSSLKGLEVEEGIGGKPGAPKPGKQYRFPTKQEFKTPSEIGYENWLAKQKAKENEPYERPAPRKFTKEVAEKHIATVKQEPAVVSATKEDVEVTLREAKQVPVVAKTTKAAPVSKTIPEGPGYKGARFKQGKPVEVTSQLEQEVALELPKKLKEAGVTSELSQTEIEAAAKKAAKSQAKAALEKRLAPLVAARERVGQALKVAIAAYKKGEKTAVDKYKAAQAALHEEQIKIWEADEENKVGRTSPVTGFKASEDILAEDEKRTRKVAKAEMTKLKEKRNPLLVEINEIWDMIVPVRQKPEYKDRIAQWKRHIQTLNAKRAAEAKAIEDVEAAIEAQYEEAKESETEKLQQYVRELKLTGVPEADVEAFQLEQEKARQFEKRQARAPHTTRIFNEVAREHPRPEIKGTGILAERQFLHDVNAWAEPWAKAMRQAFADAKIKVTDRINKESNTPEENALIYVENLLRDPLISKKWKQAGGKVMTTEQHRGQNLNDGWMAVRLAEPQADDGRTDAERAWQRHLDVQHLNGMITDASKTKSTQADPYGIKQAKHVESDAEQARYKRPVSELTEQAVRTSGTAMEAAFQEAMREKGFYAPPSKDPLASPTEEDFVDVDTTTAAEAADKYLSSKGTGWHRHYHRALVKSLKALVGDTPVHFVSGAEIAKHTPDGSERAGVFLYKPGGKSIILMHENVKNRPKLLDYTLLHEMTHAATAHAIEHNIRGTKEAIQQLMRSLFAEAHGLDMTKELSYAFNNEHEFLTMAVTDPQVQEVMRRLKVPIMARAKVRALAKGRQNVSYWDVFVETVQSAIGLVAPGKVGDRYIDQVLSVYERGAMSSAEQQADKAKRYKKSDITDLGLGAPFNVEAILKNSTQALADRSFDTSTLLRRGVNMAMTSTETIRRRVAERIFNGYDNPVNNLINELETLQRRIEEGMRPGDQADDALRRWMLEDPTTRRPIFDEAHDLVVNASIDGIDPRKTLQENYWIRDDAFHPSRRRRSAPTFKHERDTGRRAAHDRYSARWDALPDDLKPLLSDRLDLLKKQMLDYETKLAKGMLDRLLDNPTSQYTLPPGMSRSDAVKEIMDDNISPELEAALGKNAKTFQTLGRFGARDQMYAPAHRWGKHFISGRRNIATPTAAHGDVLFDQVAFDHNGVFRFVFNDLRDAVDYTNQMGISGDERVLKFQRKYIDPNGNFVPHDWQEIDANGQSVEAEAVYYVTMQDRFMEMSDSPAELMAKKKELDATGEYAYVSDPTLMAEHRGSGAMLPLQLQSIVNNISSQSGIDERDKAMAIDMITSHFIRTQQGNRITKRMIQRTGVKGFATGADELFRSFHNSNEMVARHTVALDRIPAIAKANEQVNNFLDAVRTRQPADLIKLPQKQRDVINRGYGKRDPKIALQFAEDVREINRRIDGAMRPSVVRGEELIRTVQSLATLNYLFKPVYFAIQGLGLILQTYPNMAKQMAKLDGFEGAGKAGRYLAKGFSDVGLGPIGRSLSESGQELKQALGGFKNWSGEARALRRPHDYIAELKSKLTANGAKYAEAKKKALDEAYLRNMIGQAGLDQGNIRLNVTDNKFLRGLEQSTRVFRALQEGLETVNRAAPIFSYVEYYMDKGMSESEAIENAINNMAIEQTGYSKANWPSWMGNPYLGTMFMFKKFAFQQAGSFYESLLQVAGPSSSAAERKAAFIHLATMTAVLAAFGGFAGNPLWEPLRYLMYFFGMSENWDETKTQGEKWMADLTNPMIAEAMMYGLPRLAGIDISNRVAMDSLLFYQQPEEMEQQEWMGVAGQMAIGPVGSLAMGSVGQLHSLITGGASMVTSGDSDITGGKSLPKWLSQLPAPGFVKDILKAYDLMENGPTTATGVSTGEPTGILESLITATGVKTRDQARPFEQGSQAQHKAAERIRGDKSATVRKILNAGGITSDGMRTINEWNDLHPEKEYRITARTITNAFKRRREMEQEIGTQNEEAY